MYVVSSAFKLLDVRFEDFVSDKEFEVNHFAELFLKIIEFINFDSTNFSVMVVLKSLIVVVLDGNNTRCKN